MNNVKFESLYSRLGGIKPEITIVVPVFNQETKIVENLRSIVDSCALPCRLIVIDDASTDRTISKIKNNLIEICGDHSVAVELHSNPVSLFETKCDTYGFGIAETKYAIEIQADMFLKDKGFDSRLCDALKRYPDLIAISGRGVEAIQPVSNVYRAIAGSDRASGKTILRHIINRLILRIRANVSDDLVDNQPTVSPKKSDLHRLVFPNLPVFAESKMAGRVGALIEIDIPVPMPRKIWVGETIMRGPLILDMEKYREVGGLDTKSFFQGFDEHDLFLRSRTHHGYRVGFSPVCFESPLADGTTRKGRSFKTEFLILRNLARISWARKTSALHTRSHAKHVEEIDHEIRDF